MPTQPPYYKNTLQPIQINQTTLQRTLKELQHAVIQSTKVVQNGSPASVKPADSGSIYSGTAGITLAFLRLERQKEFLVDNEHRDTTTNTSSVPDFAKLAHERIIPPIAASDTRLPPPGRMSPIGSSLGPLIVRILAACEDPKQPVSQDDISVLNGAMQHSLSHGYVVTSGGSIRGVDEVLYGRAGLLWAVLNVRCYTFDKALQTKLKPVFDAVPRLVDDIINAGRRGARDFMEMNGEEDAFPLMWPYKDERYSLGAVHGIAGILTILLSCEPEELESHLPLIADTITGLCQICIAQRGHLPSSIPPRSSSRSTHLVQICHGTPGLLALLATARRNHRIKTSFWQPEWDQAIQLGAEKAWQEGLLTKGGSLCHGLAGNAWSLLLLHECFESDSDDKEGDKISDYFLSRALSLLLLARESPPYSTALNIPSRYNFRTPDRPYSLYEGLAGELCAWAETCVVIKTRLCKLGLDEEGKVLTPPGKKALQQYKVRELGFPCLGGNGPKGIL